ncbi:MAG: tRNA pseudouridine(55) synthase TruB [Tepidisphaeraceae bacterium]
MTQNLFELHGVLNLNKPAGITSAAAVSRVKRLLPRKTKIGHAGTLDPFATGVLLLLIGRATKRCESLMGAPKQYLATLKLGATTETDDPESAERLTPNTAPVSAEALHAAFQSQIGLIQQVPPAFSALKIGGRRACDRVRAGETVQMQPRTVRIDRIDVLNYEWPLVTVRIDCGRGTYIRAIARDVGARLQVGAYLTTLCRSAVGEFTLENAVTLDQLQQAGPESLVQLLK